MDALKQLNTSDVRYLRYYIQSFHHHLGETWDLHIINGDTHKELKNTFNALALELKNRARFSFDDIIYNSSNGAKNNLVDISKFDWLKIGRAKYFTWNRLKNKKIDLNITFTKKNNHTKSLAEQINKKKHFNLRNRLESKHEWKQTYSDLCCNTNNDIFDYIIWTFDDVNNNEFMSDKSEHIGMYHRNFKFVCLNNKINWIKSEDLIQLKWAYKYLNSKCDFSFISEPKNNQLYNTVICQLDLICDYYSGDSEVWDYFLKSIKKAWSTQSDRLKKSNTGLKLDRASIQMLRGITGKGATDTMLKKKLKEIIQNAYDASQTKTEDNS